MRVCFVLHSSAKGGAERANLELIDELMKRQVTCYAILPRNGPLTEELQKRDIPFKIFPYRWWMSKNTSANWKRVARVAVNILMVIPIILQIKKWKVDVVFTNTITVCVGAIAAKLLGLPHVWHIHEFGQEDHGLRFDLGSKFSLWIMNQLSNVCIANSKAVAKKYSSFISDQKLKVIYQAVNIDDQSSPIMLEINKRAKEPDISCIIIGSLQEGKRQEDAIKAIGELVNEGINAHLYIVGDGEPQYKQHLRYLVIQGGLEDHVTFLGYVDNPLPLVRQSDVLLMCSISEAFGRVTVEAMKVGKPVIGARSGGTVELIQDGFNGLLYTPGEYKELAEKIKYIYENPDEAKQMSKNGQQWAVRNFNGERYGEEVFAVLRQLVS